ncbi:AMP-binding protein [Pantanalinema rosaneae CENA516]|uniref:AMP-binding protein n=1 Tax=Pantanalinema rosaneae TaxID=1620701 RepID=UPI003D6E7CC0
MTTADWDLAAMPPMKREAFFGDRVVRTFAQRPANFDALIRETVENHRERNALAQDARRLTYGEFDAMLSSVAANLAARGVRGRSRRRSLRQRNRRAGGAIRGASSGRDCELVALAFDAGLAHRLPEPAAAPSLRHRFSIGGPAPGAGRFEALTATRDFALVDIAETDAAIIMYTSGTTGRPKGAVLPHLAMVHSAMHFTHCLGHGPIRAPCSASRHRISADSGRSSWPCCAQAVAS